MEFLSWFGWIVAAGLGIGWWIEHRGVAGIKSDLADAQQTIATRVKK